MCTVDADCTATTTPNYNHIHVAPTHVGEQTNQTCTYVHAYCPHCEALYCPHCEALFSVVQLDAQVDWGAAYWAALQCRLARVAHLVTTLEGHVLGIFHAHRAGLFVTQRLHCLLELLHGLPGTTHTHSTRTHKMSTTPTTAPGVRHVEGKRGPETVASTLPGSCAPPPWHAALRRASPLLRARAAAAPAPTPAACGLVPRAPAALESACRPPCGNQNQVTAARR